MGMVAKVTRMTSCDEEAWDKKKSLWPILALLFQKSKVQKRLEQAQIVQDCCCCTACGARAWCHRHFLILPWRVATFLEGLFPGIRKACWKLRVTPKDAQGKTFHGVGHDSKVWYWSFERDMKALIFTAGLKFPAYGCIFYRTILINLSKILMAGKGKGTAHLDCQYTAPAAVNFQ